MERGQRLETGDGVCLRLWIVVSGTAAVCLNFPDGRRQITGIETTGNAVCGQMTAPENPGWLEALEDCQICEVDFAPHMADLGDSPDFLRAIFDLTHHRLEAATRHMAVLGRLDSTERVILFLAEMAHQAGETDPVRIPMSREDIADYLGLNAETVSRIFSRIKKSGLVRFTSPTEYSVPDMGAMQRRLPIPIRGQATKREVPDDY